MILKKDFDSMSDASSGDFKKKFLFFKVKRTGEISLLEDGILGAISVWGCGGRMTKPEAT